jgi:type IV secretory pathway VirB2 component (pilin)
MERKTVRYTYSYQHITIAFLTCAFIIVSPVLAYAGATQDSICTIVDIIWGPLGTGMAILGVCAVAAAAALGKASWGMALTVVAGISIMFGAGTLSDNLGIGNVCPNPSAWR